MILTHLPVPHDISAVFGSNATAGVSPNPNGSSAQQLVYLFGNYQPVGHLAVDFACPVGTPIVAAAPGTVVWAGPGQNMPKHIADKYGYLSGAAGADSGNITIIDHGDGSATAYSHQSEVEVLTGQWVNGGQQIGLSGKTGRITGPHLHFEYMTLPINYGSPYYSRSDPMKQFGSASIIPTGSTTSEEEDMATPEEIWSYRTKVRGSDEQAIDVLVYANQFASEANDQATAANHAAHRAEAKAEAAINAVAGLLSIQVPHPFEEGKTYALVDYIRYGNAFAGQAADASKAVMASSDPKALAEAVAQAAGAVNAQTLIDQVKVTLEVKEN
ncbi:M23 family metallopeptidase [Arthrobacter sp. zg-Y20]|uniref:M23 family metallopeptidase n=1 Tax=unclassified Arthrobacter TaxID=235627 RepID=UPI001D146BA4|nr:MULTISPECIES: M23 family metallopeptidase [unclassified Arthrobacter]MCC3276362.1 M23 family metallopeptidase [Arthrobacter sp. zg-Y20]MDK1316521.1 M23 family metallopeptidase [Arthrobacter sp. zg.Y20]WIB06562.1 M23 family metallopeptidase [Arthrobacter sp. zg-Y20]